MTKPSLTVRTLLVATALLFAWPWAPVSARGRHFQARSDSAAARPGEIPTGRVVSVADGDTVTIFIAGHDSYRIRLAGIDEPENAQAFGKVSKRNLSDLVFDKAVSVACQQYDHHGRVVGRVLIDGNDIGLLQIEAGMAWHYKTYAAEQRREDRRAYSAAEVAASGAKRGLWRDSERCNSSDTEGLRSGRRSGTNPLN